VDYRRNIWHDFGTNEGGSTIDLVMKTENCSFHEAANRLEKGSVDVQISNSADKPFSFHGDNPSIVIQNIVPITHPKLIAWVRERKIDINLANRYCREIHYRNHDKNYFSIEFKNDRDGYELSSPPNFKDCISPKNITTIQSNRDTCLVFEGFWDFLSYLTIQKIEKSEHDVAVLNSVVNVQKAMNFLKPHWEIYTYLDNDEAGQKATQAIKSACSSVNDRSERYTGYKFPVSEAGGKTGDIEEKMGDKKMNSSNRMIQRAVPDCSTEDRNLALRGKTSRRSIQTVRFYRYENDKESE
jgi:hypothetical protein